MLLYSACPKRLSQNALPAAGTTWAAPAFVDDFHFIGLDNIENRLRGWHEPCGTIDRQSVLR